VTGALLVCSATSAKAQASDYVIDLRAGAGVASNPFLVPDGEMAGFLNLEVLPEWRVATERAVTVVRGRLSADAFIDSAEYKPQLGLMAKVERNERLTERLSYNGELEFVSSTGNGIGAASGDPRSEPRLGGGNQEPFPRTDIPDPDLLAGNDQQRQSVRGAAAVRYRVSEIDSIEAGGGFGRFVYPGQTILADFNSIQLRAAYDRALDERTVVGARLDTQTVDTAGILGSFQTVTPQLTAGHRLSELWRIEGALGGLFISGERGIVPAQDRFTISGKARVCRKSPAIEFCAGLLRDVSGSGASGVVRSTTLDAYYTKILDRDTTLSVRALIGSFEDIVSGTAPTAFGDRQYRAISGALERSLSGRISAIASGVAEMTHYQMLGSATNLRFQISIGYRLGGLDNGRSFSSDR
jgi:hypothetical protein